MLNRNHFLTLALTISISMLAIPAFAQTGDNSRSGSGWGARKSSTERGAVNQDGSARTVADRQSDTTQSDSNSSTESGGLTDAIERGKEARRKALTGTWYINIPKSEGGAPPFNAYHTFNSDGTFTEVSDLLPNLTETPAHGAWELYGHDYLLTFELFVFDEQKKPAGRIRVRCLIRLTGHDELRGETVVDFIAPDGTVEKGIDRGPFTGKKLRPLSVH